MKPRKTSEKRLLHENPFSKVYHVEATFSGFTKNYYITHFGPRAGVVAVRDGRVLLVRQYRLLPDAVTLEIPGGKVEDGEDPAEAVARECLEETGYACAGLRPLLAYYPGLDNVENRTSLFVSEAVRREAAFRPDPSEVLGFDWVEIDDCLDLIFRQQLTDALTIAGILGYCVARSRASGQGRGAASGAGTDPAAPIGGGGATG
jgi:ADP-ribose pyrophosphatase